MIQPKYNGQEALERVKLMMKYDMSKTLNENKEVINEQSTFKNYSSTMPTDYLGNRGSFENYLYNGMSKEKYFELKRTLPKVNGSSVSDLLVKTRDLFFSPGGMTAQIVLSILGAEIGAPIIFQTLDGVIFLNDLLLMSEEWRDDNGIKPWSMEWIQFHMKDGLTSDSEYGNGFLRTLEDILFLASGGIFKLVGKSVKSIFQTINKIIGGKGFKIIETFTKKISNVIPKLKSLPSKIGTWFKGKIDGMNKAIELLKNPKQAVQSIKSNVLRAIAGGALTYGFTKFFESYIVPKLHGSENEITTFRENVDDTGLINETVLNNPKLFPKGIKKMDIITDKNKKFVKLIIDGLDYTFIDKNKYLLKKI